MDFLNKGWGQDDVSVPACAPGYRADVCGFFIVVAEGAQVTWYTYASLRYNLTVNQ